MTEAEREASITVENTLDDVQRVWKQTLGMLADNVHISPPQRAFANLTSARGITDTHIEIAAPNEFTRNKVETDLKSHLVEALQFVMQRPMQLTITVDEAIAPALEVMSPQPPAPRVEPDERVIDVRDSRTAASSRSSRGASELNDNYRFETFVVGQSNRFAHAAAVAVAEEPAQSYNPLFIYGNSGLGKTHLLHAIGHYALTHFPGARVKYVTSEDFLNEFINSIGKDRDAFKRKYRDIDVLLIDDIQFLHDKPETQEEFFHTFDTLHRTNKQIVITSDMPPSRLNGFEERMKSRFEWGLSVDVQPPDLETRVAILRKKANQQGITLRPEILEYIASRVSSNIRNMEGALLRVSGFASVYKSEVNLEQAETILRNVVDQDGPQINATLIMEQSSEYFGVSIEDLCGSSRARSLTHARQVAMYLCREMSDLSLPQIGQAFGGRDHTTVLHAQRKIEKYMVGGDRTVHNQVTELTARIKGRS